jgi:dTDP-4-amino-4,6-dideoxygalactose transaminase
MTDIQAAMGIVELQRYDEDMLVRRKQIFELFSQGFGSKGWAILPTYETNEKTTSYHVFLLRIKGIDEVQRNSIISRIFERQVSVNVHFIPLPMLSYYKNAGYNIDDYPVSYNNFSRVISLPVYYDLNDEQVQTVIHAVIESVEEVL